MIDLPSLKGEVERLVAAGPDVDAEAARPVVARLLGALETGVIRAAERGPTGWQAVEWVKAGILLAFRVGQTRKFATPGPEFFDRDVRTYSSGCIRIEDWTGFASLVLGESEWDDAAIQAVIDTKQTRTVYLKEPLPVLILYWTGNPGTGDGTPEFLPDVYDRDDRILTALELPFRFVPPDDAPKWLEELEAP